LLSRKKKSTTPKKRRKKQRSPLRKKKVYDALFFFGGGKREGDTSYTHTGQGGKKRENVFNSHSFCFGKGRGGKKISGCQGKEERGIKLSQKKREKRKKRKTDGQTEFVNPLNKEGLV